jgi:hypothetical protein
MGDIRYTLDGSEPRGGHCMIGPWTLATARCCCALSRRRLAWRRKVEFRFRQGQKGVQIDDVKPGRLCVAYRRRLDSRAKTYEGLKQAGERSVSFENVTLMSARATRLWASTLEKCPCRLRSSNLSSRACST